MSGDPLGGGCLWEESGTALLPKGGTPYIKKLVFGI